MKERVRKTIEVTPVWKQVTPELAAELVEFWKANRAIGDTQQAERRADQAIAVARDDAGTICAAATGVLRVLPRLQQPMYYYRTFFAKSMRGQGQVFPLFNRSVEILQQFNRQLEMPESLGLLMELESRYLVAPQLQLAHVKEVDAIFIGYSPRGLPLYVTYFEGARLMKPDQVAKVMRETSSEAA